MKNTLILALFLCFVFAGSVDSFAQQRPGAKKTAKRKLVKCRVDGKIVYRKQCRSSPSVQMPDFTPVIVPQTNSSSTESSSRLTYPDEPVSGISSGQGSGIGTGTGTGRGTGNTANIEPREPVGVRKSNLTTDLKIISKPRAAYTDLARQNQVQGTVSLRVTFLPDGRIGSIVPVRGLPNGLTQQAVAAARQIRFEPARNNGKPYKVMKIIEYSFTIY